MAARASVPSRIGGRRRRHQPQVTAAAPRLVAGQGHRVSTESNITTGTEKNKTLKTITSGSLNPNVAPLFFEQSFSYSIFNNKINKIRVWSNIVNIYRGGSY